MVTAGDDATVRVWDADTGKQKQKLVHGHWVRGLALSPDGTRISSSSVDDTVCVWDAKTGRQIYKVPGRSSVGGRRALTFTPDGKRLLSWGDDSCLRAWDMANGKAVFEHKLRPTGGKMPNDSEPHARKLMIGDAAFAPDGERLVVTVGFDIHIFDTATGQETQKIARDRAHVTPLAISPDGKYLLGSALGKPVETKLPDGRSSWSATVVLLTLVGGIIGTTINAVRANRERDNKDAALKGETLAFKEAMAALRSLTDEVVERQIGRQVTLTKDDRAFFNKIIEKYETLATGSWVR